MIRLLLLLVAILAIAGTVVGFAANWQLVGLLNVIDSAWPGAAGTRQAEGLIYGERPQQSIDVYVPKGVKAGESLPVIVWFHGGGWRDGDRRQYGFAGRAFSAAGFVTVVAGYRLGPDGRFPHFMEDAAAVVRWTRANIAAHGGDPDRLVLAGHSAGAHMAALVALDGKWLGELTQPGGAVKGVIGLSGPYDFLPFERGGSADMAMGFVRPLDNTQPIHFARADAPTLFLATGTADTTVKPRNVDALAQAMLDAGSPVETHRYPGLDHSETVMALSLPFRSKGPVLSDAVAFARRVTERRP